MLRVFILILLIILIIEFFYLIHAIYYNNLLSKEIKLELIKLKNNNKQFKDIIKNRKLLNDKLEILKSELSKSNISCQERNSLIDNFINDVLKD